MENRGRFGSESQSQNQALFNNSSPSGSPSPNYQVLNPSAPTTESAVGNVTRTNTNNTYNSFSQPSVSSNANLNLDPQGYLPGSQNNMPLHTDLNTNTGGDVGNSTNAAFDGRGYDIDAPQIVQITSVSGSHDGLVSPSGHEMPSASGVAVSVGDQNVQASASQSAIQQQHQRLARFTSPLGSLERSDTSTL
jgi:hypothetical protein